MTDEELERDARDLYQAQWREGVVQTPWEAAPEFVRAYWREIARGNAGASLG